MFTVASLFMYKVPVKLPGINASTFTIIDNDDIELVTSSSWLLIKRSRDKFGYVRTKRNGIVVFLHRLIIEAKKGEIVDHINGNSLDNRKRNLRIVTNSQNLMNRGKQSNNTTGYCGVTLDKRDGIYNAQIKKRGIRFHLGRFRTAKEAALAYNKAAVKLHGQFAKLNEFLPKGD